MAQYGGIKDVQRRIRNILITYPATDWTLEESVVVLDALSEIVRGRQTPGNVVVLASRHPLR